MNKGGDHDFNIRLGIRGFDQRPGFAMGVLFTILTVLGVLFWILLFNREDVQSTRILVVEILVNVITLGLNLYLICIVLKLVVYFIGSMKYCNQGIIMDTLILSKFYAFDPLTLFA